MGTDTAISAKPEVEDLVYRCSFAFPDFRILDYRSDLLNSLIFAVVGLGIAGIEDLSIDQKPDSPSSHSINLRLLGGKGAFRLIPAGYEISANNYSDEELLKLIEGVTRIHKELGARIATLSPTKSTIILAFHLTLDGKTCEEYFRNSFKGQGALAQRNIFGFEYDSSSPVAEHVVLVEKSYPYKNALFVRLTFNWRQEITDFRSAHVEVQKLVQESFREINLNVAEL